MNRPGGTKASIWRIAAGGIAAACAMGIAAVTPVAGAVRFEPPKVLGTSVTIAGSKEPGTRMVVTGQVVDSAGVPRAGIVIGIYQTSAKGLYGLNTLAAPIARLHGWLKTDSLGRYRVATIRPGAYPTGGTPPHIHFVVNQWSEELRFAGDGRPPLALGASTLSAADAEQRARSGDRFAMARPTVRDRDGVDHVVRDFRLRR